MTGAGAAMREVEAKFRVHAPYQLPDLATDATGVGRVEGPVVKNLHAVYWDTSDLRLAREGITVRFRTGEGANDGWHLKLPLHEAVPDASTGARDELHETGPDDRVPPTLAELVCVYVRGATLGPVATLATARSSYCLADADGRPLAELSDDAVSVVTQGHVAGRFREIEVEDVGGGVETLRRVGESLRAAGAVGGEFVPKIVRALGPLATGEPDPPPPARVRPDDSTRTAIQAILRRYVRNLMARDISVRRGEDDGVHQMRVAARRLRSALKLLRPVVDVEWARSLRVELKWLADSLGEARDGEVLLERLHRELDALPQELVVGPVRARIDATIGGNLVAAAAAAQDTLRTERYIALVDRLVSAAWDPMTTEAAERPAGEVLRPLVAAAWGRLAKGAARVRSRHATDADWHQTRILAKQVRYAAEAVVPLFGKPAKGLATHAENVQELLGEHQDAVVACGALRRLATAPRAGATSFTLGLLHAREQAVIERTRQEFPALWAEASKRSHRSWLSG